MKDLFSRSVGSMLSPFKERPAFMSANGLIVLHKAVAIMRTVNRFESSIPGDRIASSRAGLAGRRRRTTGPRFILPALFDLQINGHGGTWFS